MRTIELIGAPAEQAMEGDEVLPTIDFKMAVLPNGLTLIVHEDRRHPLVSTQVRFNVGAKDEPPGRTGFAHLFEHLMFKESTNRRGSWHQMLQAMGGTGVNGTTGPDRTNYYQVVPKAALDQLLWMESDRMGHLLGGIDAATLADEIQVVKNEKRQREGAPYGGVYEAITTTLYPREHPYGHTVLGSFEDLDNANLETVADWHARWYGPSNAVLVIAGDISFEDALAKVEYWFGGLPAGVPVRRVTEWMPEVRETRRITLFDRVPHRQLHAVWSTPPSSNPDTMILQVVAMILAGGAHSRLVRRLVEHDRLCLSIGAKPDGRLLCGEFHISATLVPGVEPAAVEAAIEEELQRFLSEGPSQEELDRVRQAGRAGMQRMLDSLGGVTDVLAGNMIAYGRPDGHLEHIAVVERATPETIRAVASRWLGQQALSLDVRPFTAVSAVEDPAERASAPAIAEIRAPGFPAVETAVLANGLELRLARCPGTYGVNFALHFDNGARLDPHGHEGLSMIAMGCLDAGTARRTMQALSEGFAELGIQYGVSVKKEHARLSMSTLKSQLPAAMSCMAELLTEPTFPQDVIAHHIDKQVASAKARGMAPAAAASGALWNFVYGPDHIYGRRATNGTAESLASLTRELIVDRHKLWLDPRRAKLVVAGDLTLSECVAIAQKAFGHWTGTADTVLLEESHFAPAPGRYRIDRPGSAQTALHLAMASPDIRPGNEALGIFNNLFGGSFGSRLNENLRVRKGWTYAVGSSFSIDPAIGAFHIQTEVQADRTLDAVAEIEAELKALARERPVTAEEIEEARHGLLVALPSRWVSNGAILNAMLGQIIFDLPQDFHDGLEARIRGVNAADIDAVVAMVGDPERFSWVAAGDPVHLGDADYRAIDAEGELL